MRTLSLKVSLTCRWNRQEPCFGGGTCSNKGFPGAFLGESFNEAARRSQSQVKLLLTNNAFCIVQRATAQSKIGLFRDCGVAEAPPGFQAC
jgi:hypothetical protein